MNRKLLILFVGLLVVIVAVAAFSVVALADDDDDDDNGGRADGLWCYTPADITVVYPGELGEHNYLNVVYHSYWTGAFTGESNDRGAVIGENFPSDAGPAMFVDLIVFDSVEVGGKTGGLEIYTSGVRETTNWGKEPWFIVGASGELEGLKGHGKWWMGKPGDECPDEYIPVRYSVDKLRGVRLDFDKDDD